jgi:hypothetical protein
VGSSETDHRPDWRMTEFLPYRDVFVHRPTWARFAILQTADDKYLCVDLFRTQIDSITLKVSVPDKYKTFTDLDAAIVAAQLQL